MRPAQGFGAEGLRSCSAGPRSLDAGPVIADDRVMRHERASQAPAIVVEGLRKDYGKVRAVDAVSFRVLGYDPGGGDRRFRDTVVPRSETALPVGFGTMLPLAFISEVFFSVSHPPTWLHDLASAFPVAPIAQAMEDSFDPATQSWPVPVSGLLVVLGWTAAAMLVIALAFRGEPGPAPAARGLACSPRWRHG